MKSRSSCDSIDYTITGGNPSRNGDEGDYQSDVISKYNDRRNCSEENFSGRRLPPDKFSEFSLAFVSGTGPVYG